MRVSAVVSPDFYQPTEEGATSALAAVQAAARAGRLNTLLAAARNPATPL